MMDHLLHNINPLDRIICYFEGEMVITWNVIIKQKSQTFYIAKIRSVFVVICFAILFHAYIRSQYVYISARGSKENLI